MVPSRITSIILCFVISFSTHTSFSQSLHLTNTLSGKKELFQPLNPPQITVYVCGLTPYDYAHIGHGRVYVMFDVLYRFLKFCGHDVLYCRNFTDTCGKVLQRSLCELGRETYYLDIADRYIQNYEQDMQALNCVSPSHEPRISDHIPIITAFIQKLIDAQNAYFVDGNIYFDTQHSSCNTFPNVQRADNSPEFITEDEGKKHPLDFNLWSTRHPLFKSHWGIGKPGCIECPIFASAYLGNQIDIHGGGMDLMYPHHENGIAEIESLTGVQFCKYWVHVGLVQINKDKMSKSLNNVVLLREVYQKYNPMVLRFYYLSNYYRNTLNFSWNDLEEAEHNYNELCALFNDVDLVDVEIAEQSSIVKEMLRYLSDDLNIPDALTVLLSRIDYLKENQKETALVKKFLMSVLGLT